MGGGLPAEEKGRAKGSAALPRRDATAADLQDPMLLVGEDILPRDAVDIVF